MRLHHKLIITFSMVSLAVLATGAAGLFVVEKIGEDIELVLEEKVAVADASSEIVSIVASSEALLHKHMLTEDLDSMDQIERELENYHKIKDMWARAIIYGTGSQEFIESEEYLLWLEYGYGAKGIVIKKAGPEIIPIIEELDVNHEKFHETSKHLMELHREKIVVQQNITDMYSEEKSRRYRMRNLIRAQDDHLLMDDMWRVEYEGKEALFQYKDKKHADEWIEAVETLRTDIANSTLAPGIKSDIQNYSDEYLLLAKTISKDLLKLNELDAEMQAQTNVLNGHIADINANVAEIRVTSLSAMADAKGEIQAYITKMLSFLAVLIVLGIVLILVVGYIFSTFVTNPVIELKDATKKTGENSFDGSELGIVFNDMAETLKKRTTELREHAKQLEHSNRLKDLFTDIIRHDLLNPVGVIRNITEIMEEDKNLKDSTEIPVIKRNVKKLEEIIHNASTYAKLESAKKLEKVELDLAKLIKDVIDDFGPYIKDKGMNVEFKPDKEYKTNAGAVIESVFVNLLSNAIKYSPDGTDIKIAIEDSGKNWKISFADRGEGISDEYKEPIFDRFTRKDKGGVKGTGLGLAIVKRIAEMHGGRVWVEDNPEGGSIFYVEMPKS